MLLSLISELLHYNNVRFVYNRGGSRNLRTERGVILGEGLGSFLGPQRSRKSV